MKASAWILALILGIVGGVLGSRYLLVAYYQHGMTENGSWRTHLDIGRSDSNPYVRALVAAGGLFAMQREEASYWTAENLGGQPLSNRCHYVIEGKDFAGSWWNITVYDHDSYLIPNHDGRQSFTSKTVARSPTGRWAIHVSPSPQEVNWLPSRKPDELPAPQTPGRLGLMPGTPDQIRLIFRLFHPDSDYQNAPTQAPLPSIRKVGCA